MKIKNLLVTLASVLLLATCAFAEAEFSVDVRTFTAIQSNLADAEYQYCVSCSFRDVSSSIHEIQCYALNARVISADDMNTEECDYMVFIAAESKFEIVSFVAVDRFGQYHESKHLLLTITNGAIETEWICKE